MGRPCTICMHADLAVIEAELEAGQPLRDIAAAYGASKTALHRHRHLHVVEPLPGVGGEARGRSGTRVPAVVRWGLWIAAMSPGIVYASTKPGISWNTI